MTEQVKFTQNQVYRRMLKSVVEMWNIPESEVAQIDPIVKMLMNALAKEMEKVGNELASSDTRLLKRLAKQLLPDQYQTAIPAHAILHFTPTEAGEINRYDAFEYEKRWKNRRNFNRIESRPIHYTPVTDAHTTPARILFKIIGSSLMEVEGLNSVPTEKGNGPNSEQHTLYLGIENLKPGPLVLYFDWMLPTASLEYYNFLPRVTITTANGIAIPFSPGWPNIDVKAGIETRLDHIQMLEHDILQLYNRRVLTLQIPEMPASPLPEKIRSRFLKPDSHELYWIKIEFPKTVDPGVIAEMLVQTNCFPVMNRKLEKYVFRLERDINIKRLDFLGYILELERIENNQSLPYTRSDALNIAEQSKGTYSLRTGGIGRLDEREGLEYLKYLMGLLREEKQAFAALDIASTLEDLESVDQVMRKIKLRLDEAGEDEKRPYVIINTRSSGEIVHVNFWTTDGTFANGIRRGSEMDCKSYGLTVNGRAILLTDTEGGRDELSEAELIQSYKTTVLTRGVVVTENDIVQFCRQTGGEVIEDVIIKRELALSAESRSGLLRVINVYIKFSASETDQQRKDYILESIESQLRSNSNFSMPIFVKNSSNAALEIAQ